MRFGFLRLMSAVILKVYVGRVFMVKASRRVVIPARHNHQFVVGRAVAGAPARDVVLEGSYAYVATPGGLVGVDVRVPTTPTVAGHVDVDGGVERVAVHAGFLYALAGGPAPTFGIRAWPLAETKS